MTKLIGLGFFWFVAEIIAESVSPGAAAWIGILAGVVVLSGIGSLVLSAVLGGDEFDHLGAGFMLALPGLLLTHYLFGWKLMNPAEMCAPNQGCGLGLVLPAMLANLLIVGVGMAIVAIPAFPLIRKMSK
jgi:hypothetical protein